MSLKTIDPTEIAIVGVGQTNYRALYEERGVKRDAHALGAAALKEAIEDAGIAKEEIDGLFVSRVGYNRMANVLGIHHPHFVQELEGSGRMSGVALQNAVALIASGQAETVACVYGNNGRSVQMKYGGEGTGEGGIETAGYDAMFGMTSPGAYVSLMYQRYRQLYGAPEDALYPVAANNRRNATKNPFAVFQEELTHEQYVNSRYIAEPMRLFDYCLINDGGVAFIVTTMEKAKTLRKKPVRIAATAGLAELTNFYTSQDFFYEASREVANRVYKQSGYGPGDMDALEIYDNFLPTILFTLEGFGHTGRGEAWQWAAENSIGYDGDHPINTSGSHTAESYMQGWALHVEAVKQIRGEAGDRQVADCNVVQYMCASPIVTSHVLTSA
jgi:acetyl-CoA acetyltransferase